MTLNIFQRRSFKSRETLFPWVISLDAIRSLAFFASRTRRFARQHVLGEQPFSMASCIAARINHELDRRMRALENGYIIEMGIEIPMLQILPEVKDQKETRTALLINLESSVENHTNAVGSKPRPFFPAFLPRVGVRAKPLTFPNCCMTTYHDKKSISLSSL